MNVQRLRKDTQKILLQDIYLGIICIFPISTMLIDGGIWNKAMFAILFVSHMCILLLRPIKKGTFLRIVVLSLQYIFVICLTRFPMRNSNLLFYYPFFILYSYYMADHMDMLRKWFYKHKHYVHGIILLWTVLVGFSMFVPRCYYYKEGGELYFGSFCESIFRLGPSALFIQVLALVSQVLYRNKKAIWYMLVPLYCYFMGSSRTYLIIGLCLLAISWYIMVGNKMFWLSVIPLGVTLVMLVWMSPMGEKIRYTLDESRYGDFWFKFTSSRSVIWNDCLTEWNQTRIFNKLFGNDLGFTYYAAGNWAHNDFIEILCTFGVVGLLNYLDAVVSMLRQAFVWKNVPIPVRLCTVMVWLFNAFFNMHYVYFCAMLSYPILMMVIQVWSGSTNMPRTNKEKWDNEE